MKNSTIPAIAFCCFLALSGCQTDSNTSGVSTGVNSTPVPVNVNATDPVVVNAEKTLLIARDTFNLFVHLEKNNRASLMKVSPEIHNYSEVIRKNGIKWIRTTDNLKETYKNNRTAENKANFLTALAVVSDGLRQSQTYIQKSGFTAP